MNKIKWIRKVFRTPSVGIAYSSAVFLSSRGKKELTDTKDKHLKTLLYRKLKIKGFWGNLKNLLFSKGKIVSREQEETFSPKNRYIYFGQWHHVKKYVGSASLIFSRSMLSRVFKGMAILLAFLVLFFNAYRSYWYIFAYRSYWYITAQNHLGIYFFLIIPLVWAFLARKLRFRLWKVLIVFIFYLLLLFQSLYVGILITFISIASLTLFSFPIKQACYSYKIWIDEITKGNIISVKKSNNIRGIITQKGPLVTQLSINYPAGLIEERIYFNERFFKDIIKSNDWVKLRTI